MPQLRLILIIGFAILLLAVGVASAREGADGAPQQQQFQPDRPIHALHRAGVLRQMHVRPMPHPPGSASDRNMMGPDRRAFDPGAPGAPRLVGQPGNLPPQRSGGLTPDERKALRQQIDAAGRDVYPPVRGPHP